MRLADRTAAPPRLLSWGFAVDGDPVGAWSTSAQHGDGESGGGAVGLEAFLGAWAAAQASWAVAVLAFVEYRQSSRDAELKGLADFGGRGQDIDIDAESETFGRSCTVSGAYARDGHRIEPLALARRLDLASPEQRRVLTAQRVAIAHARQRVATAARLAEQARDILERSRPSCLPSSTFGDATALAIEPGSASLHAVDACAWTAALSALPPAGPSGAAGEALSTYMRACSGLRSAYAEMGEILAAVVAATGGTATHADRVRAAVEAIPLMELTLHKCRALLRRCNSVPWSYEAGTGGARTANGHELTEHVGIILSWHQQMTTAVGAWTRRLATAHHLVDQVR
ncbi:MAG TPA: hypothetical protein VGM88_32615 [Kofleriaceae bacterium]|jgi:hypothetical protein